MHRIDTDGATADNLFTDGNPAAGQEGTIFDAAWLNDMQESIAQAIEGAEIPLAKGNGGQLLAAILALAAGAVIKSVNLAANGHIEFVNGLIVNWGSATQADNSGAELVTFDKPFVTGVLAAYASNSAGGPPVAFHGTGGASTTQMTVWSSKGPGSVAAAAGVTFNWLAIGK